MLRKLTLVCTLTALLAACGGGGGDSGTAPVVTPPAGTAPTISSFTASAASVQPGQSAVLSWQASGAASVSIDNGVGTVASRSSVTVTPAGSTQYTLTVSNAAGAATARVTIAVAASSPPPSVSTVSAADASAPFTLSYRASALDSATGTALGGTEFRLLVAHKGRLFGGLEGFMDRPPAGTPRATARIVVAGHSQGGGHAAMLGKMRPVQRVAMFAAPADYNETLKAPSPWLAEPGLTPTSAYIGFDHVNDPLVKYAATWAALGLPAFGPVVTIEQSSTPFACSRQLVTALAVPAGATATQVHNAVVVDGATPTLNG